jgi:hypothetical protein
MSARILGENNDMSRVPRPSNPKNPHVRAPEACPAIQKPAFSGHENSSFLAHFGRPDFWLSIPEDLLPLPVLRGLERYKNRFLISPCTTVFAWLKSILWRKQSRQFLDVSHRHGRYCFQNLAGALEVGPTLLDIGNDFVSSINAPSRNSSRHI